MFLNCNKQYVEYNLIIETTEYRLQVCFHLVFPHKSDNFFMSFSEQQFSSHYKRQPTSSFVMVSAHSHALPRRVIKMAFNIDDDDDSHASIIPREFSTRDSMESCSQWKSSCLQRLYLWIFNGILDFGFAGGLLKVRLAIWETKWTFSKWYQFDAFMLSICRLSKRLKRWLNSHKMVKLLTLRIKRFTFSETSCKEDSSKKVNFRLTFHIPNVIKSEKSWKKASITKGLHSKPSRSTSVRSFHASDPEFFTIHPRN